MGLDMYLYAEKYEAGLWKHMADTPDREKAVAILQAVGWTADDVHPGGLRVIATVAYWRKANHIHRWFVQNVQGGVDECQQAYVTREQLEQLREEATTALERYEAGDRGGASDILPTESGFFFGDTEIDEWYAADLRDTVEQIGKVLRNPKFADATLYYQSSW